MPDQLKIGDEVTPKGFDTKMVIESLDRDIAICFWMNKGKKEVGRFPVNVLSIWNKPYSGGFIAVAG